MTIDNGTKRKNNNLGDIVAIHDDNVQLTGSGYATFKIIRIKGYSKAKFESFMESDDGTEKSKYMYNLLTTAQESTDLNGNDTVKQAQILTSKLKKND